LKEDRPDIDGKETYYTRKRDLINKRKRDLRIMAHQQRPDIEGKKPTTDAKET
jgi:hypothetical protein